ncbi:MAG: alpha/beta fold hydrolase, partial [Planctomycetota bacterium]
VQGEGDAVVLIHGFAGSWLEWKVPGIVDLLADEYKVIALDSRGHGESGKPQGVDQYGVKMIDDVVRLLDHLKIEKAHLAGYSMGGLIALKMAATHPDRMRSATIVDVGWITADSEHAREFKEPPDRIPQGVLRDYFRSAEAFLVTAEEIEAIKVPILFLLAENDVWAASAEPLKAIRPDFQIVIIEDADHGTVLLKPKLKLALKAFVDQPN